MIIRYHVQQLFILLMTIFIFVGLAHAKEFHVEGSDLLMGVGANAIGMGGAVTAGTNDIHSVYWNPAGLAELNESQVSLSKQVNSKILPINFAGIAFTTGWLKGFGLKSTIALSWIPRLHFKSVGAYTENDIESIFLRFALPNLPSDFDGEFESKTKDNRISFAIMPEENAKWSLGFNFSKVDCETFFCGTTARNPGQYVISSTKATAYAFGVGAKYFASPDLTFGFNFKDIDTALDVVVKTEYADGSVEHTVFSTSFPKDLTLGAQWQYQSNMKLSLDYQTLFGNYGINKVDFRILRSGLEYTDKTVRYRLGLLAPLKLEAGEISGLADNISYPIAPTFGMGWTYGKINVDTALYPQLVMSAQRETLVPGLDLSLTGKF